MRKNSGISMITLVITIVILIILAGISIYYGANVNIDKATDVMAYNEIFEVSEATAQRALMNRISSSKYELVGTPLDESTKETVNGITYAEGWYKLTPADSEKLNLENVKRVYLINYATGEVVSKTPIYYENVVYYTSADMRDVVGAASVTVSPDMYDEKKGVNKPIVVAGMIPVRRVGNSWIVTSTDDERWYDYSSDNKVWANVMLTDEIEISGYTNEQIRNASLAELENREVRTMGSMFVWIPRFSCNAAGENIVYSYLCDDYTENGNTVSDSFTSGLTKLTGIWLSKYDAEVAN